MGQKIHPLGFRVGITKRHQAVWFARFHKHQYAQTVLEDRLLRQTLSKLLPELLKEKSSGTPSRISHIKIERGLIPYEIGIQIHAENCDAIKAAVDNLEILPNFVQNLLKNKFVLEQAALKGRNGNVVTSGQVGTDTVVLGGTEANENATVSGQTNRLAKANRKTGRFGNQSRMTQGAKNRFGQNTAKRRSRKRQNILERFRERFLENMLIIKNNKKITRKPFKQIASRKTRKISRNRNVSRTFSNFNKGRSNLGLNSRNGTLRGSNSQGLSKSLARFAVDSKTSGNSQKTAKFVNVFVSKMNTQFVNALKLQLNEWAQFMDIYKKEQIQKYGVLRYAPVGYQKKWSLTRIHKLERQPVNVLMKLLRLLQKQALKKMEILRKEFLVFGTFSKTKSFSYYQRIRFIKELRTLIQRMKTEQNLLVKQKSFATGVEQNRQMQKKYEKSILSLNEIALRKKFTNIKNENRKVKFIDYLQDVVKQHRYKNLFLYLGTMSDSRKYLRTIQQFTKQQANFLFGMNAQSLKQMSPEKRREFVKNQVSKALTQANRKNEFQKTLQDVYLEQIQKQKTMHKKNLALTPKISFKFYSVKPQTLDTKASIVADSIVDDLEKRKAFRRVIKVAQENLMKNSKVKGVKIQVSGRLNGAEIARSEWVRAGRVPLQTLRANIDYCYKTAQTIYGIIGVKVWIYKGYTKTYKQPQKTFNLFQ